MSQLKADVAIPICQADQGVSIRQGDIARYQSGFPPVKGVTNCSSMVMLTEDYWFKSLTINK